MDGASVQLVATRGQKDTVIGGQITGRHGDFSLENLPLFGIDPETARQAVSAGANVLVAGTAAFKGGPSAYAANIEALRGAQ